MTNQVLSTRKSEKNPNELKEPNEGIKQKNQTRISAEGIKRVKAVTKLDSLIQLLSCCK